MRIKMPFKIGDLVTSDFHPSNRNIERKITSIHPDKQCGSGFRASADGGAVCPHCGRQEEGIYGVDSAWFESA